MAEVRVLTDKGTERFIDYIVEVKTEPKKVSPLTELGRQPWSLEFTPHLEVEENLSATTRMGLGEYLVSLFKAKEVERKNLLNNPGLWSYLALLWFDKLCPVKSDGSRNVRETSRYVCSTNYTDYYRHLIASSWDIYYLHGKNSRLFLWTPLDIHNDFIEQLASRQNIITNKALIEVFDRLYWDEKVTCPKTGAQSRKRAGNFRRLLTFVHQIELNYDLYAMSADDILTLLPPEYDSWKSSG